MTERDAFLRAIAADVYDDTPRLAFADWLDERGEHDRAEFIRVQCELEPIRDKYEIPRAAELHQREEVLLREHGTKWLGPRPERWSHWETPVAVEFRRGFPDLVRLNPRRILEDGALIRSTYPTLRRLVIHCFNGWGEQIAAREALRGIPELELACWYDDADVQALAASPHLGDLRTLVLWTGRQRDCGTDADLCRLAAEGTAWPDLRELILVDPEGEEEADVRQLVGLVNNTAGRDIGRYERGYPELFPLAGEYHSPLPIAGRLPDGRAAVAGLECDPPPRPGYRPHPPFVGFVLVTFDATGAQTDEVIRVALPPELARQQPGYEHQRALTAATGFVPAFIRVKGFELPGHDYYSPRRGRYDSWDVCGYPDGPGADSGGDDVFGRGGAIYDLARNGEFEVDDGGWADKTGQVHST